MKNLLTFALSLAITTTAFSNGNTENKKAEKAEQVKLIETKHEVYKLIYPFKEASDVKISFLDENGKVLNTDKVKSEIGFMKSYDLSNLSAGNYTVQIEDQDMKIEKPLAIYHKANLAVTSESNEIYKLHVDFPSRSDLYVNIYNEKGQLVHHEKHARTNGFVSSYDLSNVTSESFTFEVRGYDNIERTSVSK